MARGYPDHSLGIVVTIVPPDPETSVNPITYEDTSFVTGESPTTVDVNDDLGRNGSDGYFTNDGDGDIEIQFSKNGTTFGEKATIKKDEVVLFKGLDIDTILLTWVADSSYRILVV